MAEILERIEVRPTGAALGADIEGVDLSCGLSADMVDAIRKAWADHLVLRFRGQRLDDDQLMRFSAHFGELDLAPVIAAARVKTADGTEVEAVEEGPRYVSVISNIIENGKAKRTTIQQGLTDDTDVEVLKGLQSGEQIIAVASPALVDGTAVAIKQ